MTMADETGFVKFTVHKGVLIGTILLEEIMNPSDAGEVAGQLLDAARKISAKTLIVDLRNVRAMSSSMLGELLRLNRLFKRAGGLIALLDPTDPIRKLLEMMRFGQLAPICNRDSTEFATLIGDTPPAPAAGAPPPS